MSMGPDRQFRLGPHEEANCSHSQYDACTTPARWRWGLEGRVPKWSGVEMMGAGKEATGWAGGGGGA